MSLTPEGLDVRLNSEAKDSRDISLLRSENSGVPRYYKHRTPPECPPRISSPRLLGSVQADAMTKALVTIALMLAMASAPAFAQQTAQEPTQPPKPRPRALTFAERMKQYLARTGATVDETKSAPDMIVSNSADAKGGKITVVLVNDRRRNLLGFYIYNFGSVKNAANKEEVYKYLLEANDAITIGSFFVDPDEDIGYKYLVNGAQTMSQAAFESTYFTLTSVARERKTAIRKLLSGSAEKEKPPDVKKSGEEKPPLP